MLVSFTSPLFERQDVRSRSDSPFGGYAAAMTLACHRCLAGDLCLLLPCRFCLL